MIRVKSTQKLPIDLQESEAKPRIKARTVILAAAEKNFGVN